MPSIALLVMHPLPYYTVAQTALPSSAKRLTVIKSAAPLNKQCKRSGRAIKTETPRQSSAQLTHSTLIGPILPLLLTPKFCSYSDNRFTENCLDKQLQNADLGNHTIKYAIDQIYCFAEQCQHNRSTHFDIKTTIVLVESSY